MIDKETMDLVWWVTDISAILLSVLTLGLLNLSVGQGTIEIIAAVLLVGSTVSRYYHLTN